MSVHWQSQVPAKLLGSLVLAFYVFHSVKTLGAGRRQRWATRVLEGRVTGAAISLPPQEGCGCAVTSSPPARVPNQSTQYLSPFRVAARGGAPPSSGASLTTSATHAAEEKPLREPI